LVALLPAVVYYQKVGKMAFGVLRRGLVRPEVYFVSFAWPAVNEE